MIRPANDRPEILGTIRSALVEKSVPKHRLSFWYYLGGLTLLAFFVQIVTGILLLYYFQPGPGVSAKSLETIVRYVPFGWFVRSLHSWSGSLAILLTIAHMSSAFFLKAYRSPRRSLWFTGVPLLLLMLAFGYTGSLLPQVQGSTLRAFYVLHVAILPVIGCVIVAAHLLLTVLLGNSVPDGATIVRRRRFFPEYVLGELIVWLVALAVLLVVAWFLPWEFNGAFFSPPEAFRLNIPSDWYLLWQSGWLDQLPSFIYWVIVAILLALLLLIPRFTSSDRGKRMSWIGAFVLLILIGLSALAYFSSPADFTTSAISTVQPGGAQDTVVTPDHP